MDGPINSEYWICDIAYSVTNDSYLCMYMCEFLEFWTLFSFILIWQDLAHSKHKINLFIQQAFSFLFEAHYILDANTEILTLEKLWLVGVTSIYYKATIKIQFQS